MTVEKVSGTFNFDRDLIAEGDSPGPRYTENNVDIGLLWFDCPL